MKKFLSVISAMLLTLIIAFSAGCFTLTGNGNVSMQGASNVTVNVRDDSARTELSYSQAYKEVKDSVVALVGQAQSGVQSRSSGVIVDLKRVDSEGNDVDEANEFFIVTCHHCVEDVDRLTAYLVDSEGRNYNDTGYSTAYAFTGTIGGDPSLAGELRLVGSDPDADLALLKFVVSDTDVANNITKAQIMDTERYSLSVGDEVMAVGNPMGNLPGTMTSGRISYLKRIQNVSGVGAMELMQIEVATNHGNSGGGLFNLYGELIGITNAGIGIVNGDDYDGLNFAIPLVTDTKNQGVISVVRQLASTATATNYGYIEGKWNLGLSVYDSGNGLYVESVETGSAAAEAGIRADYKITHVTIGATTYQITSLADFSQAIDNARLILGIGGTLGMKLTSNNIFGSAVTCDIPLRQYIFRDTGK